MDADLVRRIERAWAVSDVEHAEALARTDPSWGTQVFPVGDGWAVLCGPGLYVNRVLAAGLALPGPRPETGSRKRRIADMLWYGCGHDKKPGQA